MPVSVTKYVQIERPVIDAYTFLADPATMPKWGHTQCEVDQARGERALGNGYAARERLPHSPLSEAQRDSGSRFHRRRGGLLVGDGPRCSDRRLRFRLYGHAHQARCDAHGSIRGWHEADGRGTNSIESLRRSALTRPSISHQIRMEPLYVSQTYADHPRAL
jgi:hypothetical protein